LTCTEKANFAYHLLRLGKQNHDPGRVKSERIMQLEQEIVGHFSKTSFNVSAVPFHPNPIFL
jgi:hypothetical protein